MVRRIKYKLLCWLLDDICLKSNCKDCALGHIKRAGCMHGPACEENDIFVQARRAWCIKE